MFHCFSFVNVYMFVYMVLRLSYSGSTLLLVATVLSRFLKSHLSQLLTGQFCLELLTLCMQLYDV